jgi:hypothetical protein
MDWEFSCKFLGAQTCTEVPQLSSNAGKVKCCLHTLSERLKSYETMVWREIVDSDKNGSHFISLTELKSRNNALYEKFQKLFVEDCVDEPFSLRINGAERIWGIVLSDGTFESICYDPLHLGWPTSKN